jgi:hypothetical protein
VYLPLEWRGWGVAQTSKCKREVLNSVGGARCRHSRPFDPKMQLLGQVIVAVKQLCSRMQATRQRARPNGPGFARSITGFEETRRGGFCSCWLHRIC